MKFFKKEKKKESRTNFTKRGKNTNKPNGQIKTDSTESLSTSKEAYSMRFYKFL